jgi:hypothetical protein
VATSHNLVAKRLHLPLCFCLWSCFSFLFAVQSATLFLAFLLFWGMVVVADSPLLSTLVAQNAQQKGTTLTIVNSIGLQLR